MPALSRDLRVEQGADFRVELPDVDGQDRPRQRVGWEARAAIRHTPDSDVLAKPQVSFLPGRVVLTIPGIVSARWRWSRSRWEVALRGPQGQRERFATGRVILEQSLMEV